MKIYKYFLTIMIIASLWLTGCEMGLNSVIVQEDTVSNMPGGILVTAADIPENSFFNPETEQEIRDNSHYGYVIVRIEADFDEKLIDEAGAEIVGRTEMDGNRYLYVKKSSDVLKLLNLLKQSPGVVYAEADVLNKLYTPVTYSGDLDDPRINSSQYSYHITELGEALKTHGVGGNEIFIATIDSGINKLHEEFNGIFDASHEGYSMFSKTGTAGAVTYSFVGADMLPVAMDNSNWDSNPGEGHGTHVSGTILAEGNNGIGVTGICPDNAKYLFYKCFADQADGTGADGSGSGWAVYGSFKHLVDFKVNNPAVIEPAHTIPVNMSLGGDWASYFAIDVINYGLKNKVVAIVASGNDGFNISAFPAAYQGVIAVGATNGRDEKVHFSNSGKHLSVTAPGFNIISTGNTASDEYVYMSGTSMAAPFVTGLVGLMLTHDPTLSPALIKYLLESNADDKGPVGFDEDYGWGRVNAAKTIQAVIDHQSTPVTSPYSEYILDAKVVNGTNDVSGIPVYLYKTTGEFVASALTSATGTASFGLLRDGDYDIKVFYFGEKLSDGSDPVKTVSLSNPTAHSTVNFDFNFGVYNIITAPNAGTAEQVAARGYGADSAIDVYHVSGTDFTLLTSFDMDALDKIAFPLKGGEEYIIGISAYIHEGTPIDGHYAIRISTDDPAADSYTGKADITTGNDALGELNDTLETAHVISLETTYDAYLNGAEFDYYRITIP